MGKVRLVTWTQVPVSLFASFQHWKLIGFPVTPGNSQTVKRSKYEASHTSRSVVCNSFRSMNWAQTWTTVYYFSSNSVANFATFFVKSSDLSNSVAHFFVETDYRQIERSFLSLLENFLLFWSLETDVKAHRSAVTVLGEQQVPPWAPFPFQSTPRRPGSPQRPAAVSGVPRMRKSIAYPPVRAWGKWLFLHCYTDISHCISFK